MTRTLADVVHVLTRPHIPEGETRAIYAEPLFDTIQSLIHPSASQKSDEGGGGGGGSRPPLNLDAVTLWQEIKTKIDREWPYAGHPAAVKATTRYKLQAWHSRTEQPHDALYLYELCVGWESRIREALNRTKVMPIKGECPNCHKTHVETEDDDGIVRFNPALLAYPGPPTYAICQVCPSTWVGGEVNDLAAQVT